jgi:hypothetical protein
MERREYSVERKKDLLDIQGYIELFYVQEGDGIKNFRGDNFDIYHVQVIFGETPWVPEGMLVSLCFPNNRIILSGSPKAILGMAHDLEDLIGRPLRTESIVKSLKLVKEH